MASDAMDTAQEMQRRAGEHETERRTATKHTPGPWVVNCPDPFSLVWVVNLNTGICEAWVTRSEGVR